jgi:hypothetical protein
MLGQGLRQTAIAQKLGTTPSNVDTKIRLLRNAGKLPDYVPRAPSFWESPDRQARLKELHA